MCAQNIIWARASTLNSGCQLVRNYGNRDGNFLDGWHGIFGFLIMKGLAWHGCIHVHAGLRMGGQGVFSLKLLLRINA
jgi:hypothetical protein